MVEQKKQSMRHWIMIALYLIIYDVFSIAASFGAALWVRFDCHFQSIPFNYLSGYYKSILIYVVLCVIVYYCLNLYNSIWRFAGYNELWHGCLAVLITSLLYIIALRPLSGRMPVSFYLFGTVFQFLCTMGVRFMYRFVILLRGRTNVNQPEVRNVLVFGAGNAARQLIKDIKIAKETSEKVVCILDDNPNKWGRYIDGISILGGREKIAEAVDKYNVSKIYVAIPSANAQQKRDILSICNETHCEVLNMPGMYQLYTGEVTVSQMKEVAIEDLLGRDPIKVNMDEIFDYIKGKVILVTGGGGSIGSELCRQIASHQPKQLIIFDVYENNAYDIQLELKKKYPQLDLQTIIGSVRDSRKIFQVFETYKPEIVYHAAAHKHVPLMEDSPCESIKNNVIGTYKTAYAAMAHGTKRFVLISTDKAVNPTNIMGATRIIETTKKYQGCLKQYFKNAELILRTTIGGILESFLLLINPRSEKVILSS